MKKHLNIALLASGNGSNAENIIRYFEQQPHIQFKGIYTNKKEAYVLQRAANLGIDGFYISPATFRDGEAFLELMQQKEIDFIVLAGFLLKIPAKIIEHFPYRIINIHPALLPKFGGKGMYGDRVHQAVKEAGEKESGISIHFVNENYDEGQIIFQKSVAISPQDSPDDIAAKIHQLEYAYFPKVLEETFNKYL